MTTLICRLTTEAAKIFGACLLLATCVLVLWVSMKGAVVFGLVPSVVVIGGAALVLWLVTMLKVTSDEVCRYRNDPRYGWDE